MYSQAKLHTMNPKAANEYLKARVLTATPEQLQMMLYDGAIRFCEQAKVALAARKFDVSFDTLTKAQKILLELHAGLRHEVAPDLCRNLGGLYMFCYRKLVEANTQHTVAPIDEALNILKYQRETWGLLLEKLGRRHAGEAARHIDMPAPSERMEASISIQG